jgi:hypothetical protein
MRPPKRTHPIRYPPSPNARRARADVFATTAIRALTGSSSDDVPCTDTLLGTQLEFARRHFHDRGSRNLYALLRYYFYTCRKKAKWVSQTWAEGRCRSQIPSSPRPPAGKGAAEAILVRPAIKGAFERECLE